MSLINDALKQARKDLPVETSGGLPPLQPVQNPPSGTPAWLWPVLVILLVLAAAGFIGWAMTQHTQNPAAPQPTTVAAAAPAVAPAPQPAPAPPPATNVQVAVAQTTNAASAPVNKPFVLKLQGIDYSAKTPSAILNGKTVRTGDVFHEYRVKTILQDAVILIGPDNKPVQLGI